MRQKLPLSTKKEAKGYLTGNWAPGKATRSAAACSASSGRHSQAERSRSLAPTLGCSPRGVLRPATASARPVSSPPLPRSARRRLSLRKPFQGDAIVTGTVMTPQLLGLINGPSAKAGTQGEVYEAFIYGSADGFSATTLCLLCPCGSHETIFSQILA